MSEKAMNLKISINIALSGTGTVTLGTGTKQNVALAQKPWDSKRTNSYMRTS